MKNFTDIKLPYGKSCLGFRIDSARILGIINSRAAGDLPIKVMLSRKIGEIEPSLLKKIHNKKRVLFIVPDGTRHAHLKTILPVLIGKIRHSAESIDIIIASGLHARHTRTELLDIFGAGLVKRHKFIAHSLDRKYLMDLGETSLGVPVKIDKRIREYDFIISIGVIEPHLYAGYSGGAKTAAIGLAGEDTINATHGVKFLTHPMVKIGTIDGNPFQETLWEIAAKLRVDFSVNVVNDTSGKALGVFCGALKDVFREGVGLAERMLRVEVQEPADAVICGVGYPKDINLYQASRAINYILNVDRPIVKRGGLVVIVSELREGAGHSFAEKRFFDMLTDMRDLGSFISRVEKDGFLAGEHRAYMVARPLRDYHVMFVSGKKITGADKCPFGFVKGIEEALRHINKICGSDSRLYIVPRALSTIATVKK